MSLALLPPVPSDRYWYICGVSVEHGAFLVIYLFPHCEASVNKGGATPGPHQMSALCLANIARICGARIT